MTSQDFEMFAGDSKTLIVTVKDAAGAIIDLTGATIKWQAAKSVSKTPLISKSTSAGITVAAPTTGVFTVQLDPADTDALAGNFYHEAQVTDSGGNISTVMTGAMTIDKDLIRP